MVEKDKITIDSQVHEDVNAGEYVELYNKKAQELYELRATIAQGKQQLRAIGEPETSEEIEKFKELLIKADILKKKGELVATLQIMELQIQTKEKELKSLTPVMKEINDKNGSKGVPKDNQ